MLKKQEIGIVKKLDTLENRAKCAYLALGSNLGNRNMNINKAKILLINYGIKIIKCSKIYETESWPNKKLPKYLNIVIKIYTCKKPFELFKILDQTFTVSLEIFLKLLNEPKLKILLV